MKKYILTIISCLCLSLCSISAKTILGVKELTPKSEAIKILRDMYGYSNVSDDGSYISILDPTFGGFFFSMCSLYFTPINGQHCFNGAKFQRWFELADINDAKSFRDSLLSAFERKYKDQIYNEYKNEQGFKCCEFGTYADGSIGCVELEKGEGNDGVKRVYVKLYYFAFNNDALMDEL